MFPMYETNMDLLVEVTLFSFSLYQQKNGLLLKAYSKTDVEPLEDSYKDV